MRATISTATGRRDQCFSPSPATSGSSNSADDDYGHNQQKGRFQTRRQERQDRVDPEEREIGFRRGLDDGGIRLSGGTERAEEERTGDDGEHDGRREDRVFPCGVRHKGYAVFGSARDIRAHRWISAPGVPAWATH
jgi:hypothetical protein